jgi:Tfp pilus assembly protein PilZ
VTVEDETRIARLGEDDFAVLLADGGRGEARQVAAALRSQVERFRFFDFDGPLREPQVTISLGTASFPADADRESELLERAGDALNEARSMGRNRVWCYLRRPRVPLQVPVFFDGSDSTLLGYMRDLSPSGIFLQTTAGIDVGMRCALNFPLPGHDGRVRVVGRVVRTVPPQFSEDSGDVRIPGLGVEFERFGDAGDRRAIDSFLHGRETTSLRPETGILSVDS